MDEQGYSDLFNEYTNEDTEGTIYVDNIYENSAGHGINVNNQLNIESGVISRASTGGITISIPSGNLTLAVAGSNRINITGDMLPTTDLLYNLGAVDKQFNEVFADQLTLNLLTTSSLKANTISELNTGAGVTFNNTLHVKTINCADRLSISTDTEGIDLLPASGIIYCSTNTIQAGQINVNKIMTARIDNRTTPIRLYTAINPTTSYTIDLGLASLKYSNIYSGAFRGDECFITNVHNTYTYTDIINGESGGAITVNNDINSSADIYTNHLEATTFTASTSITTPTLSATTSLTTPIINGKTATFDASAATSGYPMTLAGRLSGGNDLLLAFQDVNKVGQWHMQLNNGSLEFTEDGVADGRLFLEAGGNVGINTRNPAYNLDVVGNAKISSTLTAGAGIQFTNGSISGYSPSSLSAYEESTSVGITFTGAWNVLGGFQWIFTRVGNVVTVKWPDMQRTASSVDTIKLAGGAIPVKFRPTAVVRVSVIGMDNGANYPYPLGSDFGTDGSIV